jgi:hypothetical protein
MKRRKFIALASGAAAWPLTASAQQRERVRRIGMLLASAESDPDVQTRAAVFRQALAVLGWTEGRNLEIIYRWGAGDIERMRTSVAELVGLAPDIIVCNGTPVLGLLYQATRSIPIVFADSDIDPLGQWGAGCKFVRYALTRYSAIRGEANLGAVTSGRPARTTPPPSRFSSVRRGVGESTVVIRTVRRTRRGSP